MVTTPWVSCALCGLPSAYPLTGDDGRHFCCTACREVAGLLAKPVDLPLQATQVLATTEIQLTLGNMWCGSCAWLVCETLRRTPGVHTADVSFVQRIARVVIDPALISARQLQRLIRRLGYEARLPNEAVHDEEEALFTRLAICFVFVLHDIIVGTTLYGRELMGMNTPEDAWLITFFQIMMLVGALPLLFILGIPILRAGFAGLLRGRPDMHSLITLGTIAAVALSIYHLVLGIGKVYFDTASMLLYLIAVGRWLELRAQRAGGHALDMLMERLPQLATVLTPDGERQIHAEQVVPGAKIRVRAGERFPVDGIVAAGEGDVDESLLTGEPAPVAHAPGDRVWAGTFNLDGLFDVVTMASGAQTTAGKIGHMLREALWRRAPIERLADRLAALLVPVAALLALGAFAFWSSREGIEFGMLTALAVLLIACPCALGIATPLALAVGVRKAAEAGIIPRSNAAIEQLATIRTIFFDKTGTLTRLPLRIQALLTDGVTTELFLQRIAAVETGSTHPLAQSIIAECQQRNIPVDEVTELRIWSGRGISGKLGGDEVVVGNRQMVAAQLYMSDRLKEQASSWEQRGMLVVYGGWNGRVTGLIGFGEEPRPETDAALALLKQDGIDVAVLSGDTNAAGRRWQQALGIPVYAELLPQAKMEQLRAAAGPVAMVGDGINDGPALAAATVGIALGHGTDVARATADMVLLNDDLRAIPWLVQLSRTSMRIVRQNLIWACVYNVIGLGLALAGQLQPVLAAIAMVLSSALVTGNALRLRKFPLPPWIAASQQTGDSTASITETQTGHTSVTIETGI